MNYLEDVFKKSGIPTHTFVKPEEYTEIFLALRTKGRGLVVEGPSGIGKTTCIIKALEELGQNKQVLSLSAKKKGDLELIESIPNESGIGTVIIDDFHVLPDSVKVDYARYLKVLADEEREDSKIVLVGINKAANSLVNMSSDLNNRITTIRLGRTSIDKIENLVSLGENALNVLFTVKKEIAEYSRGSFHIAQYLCNKLCVIANILQQQSITKAITTSFDTVKNEVLTELDRTFSPKAKKFATGSRLIREGRAPYLMLLYWLSQSDDWTLDIHDVPRKYPSHRISVGQIVDKGYVQRIIEDNESIQEIVHYDSNSKIFTTEDPKFMFYIQNINWNDFARQVGYTNVVFDLQYTYDFAISFAGEDRVVAEKISRKLMERELAVFYDKNEQHRLLADNIEEYLINVYSKESRFVIVLLSEHYPKKYWTKIESDAFGHRFGEKAIIPVRYSNCTLAMFDESKKYGGLDFDPSGDIDLQITEMCNILSTKMTEL